METKELSVQIDARFILEIPPVYEGPQTKVYRAQDVNLGRTVGIKEVDIQGLPRRDAAALQSEIHVWVDYAAKSSKLPQILNAFVSEGKQYIVMQWIEGKTLRKLIDENALPLERKIDYMIQLCDALEPIHRGRKQHKDLKPENIQITKDHKLYLLDFNISAAVPHAGIGSGGYLAPECSGVSLQSGASRVDVYAIGVILYELLTGCIPVFGLDLVCDPSDKQWQIFTKPSERVPGLPERLDCVAEKCMALQAKDRYPDASAVARDLRSIQRSLNTNGRRQI